MTSYRSVDQFKILFMSDDLVQRYSLYQMLEYYAKPYFFTKRHNTFYKYNILSCRFVILYKAIFLMINLYLIFMK